MKNLLALIGLITVGYMAYVHPTTQKVGQCVKTNIDGDKIINDFVTKTKNLQKTLDN